jgi:hypothetical protein
VTWADVLLAQERTSCSIGSDPIAVTRSFREPLCTPLEREADARIRTGDPFITSEVLYQLSYVGGTASL